MATKKKPQAQPEAEAETQTQPETEAETQTETQSPDPAVDPKVEAETAVAAVDEKVAKETAKATVDASGLSVSKDEVMYVSRANEFQPFEILVNGRYIKSVWNRERTRLIWRVKKADVERFERHYMVREGRIVKA